MDDGVRLRSKGPRAVGEPRGDVGRCAGVGPRRDKRGAGARPPAGRPRWSRPPAGPGCRRDGADDGVEQQGEEQRGEESEVGLPACGLTAVEERHVGEHNEGERNVRPVTVHVQAGAEGEDQGAGPHDRTEERDPLSAQHDGPDDEGDLERDADVGPVLQEGLDDDVPVGVADRDVEESPERGVAQGEVLIEDGVTSPKGIDQNDGAPAS